MENVLQTYIRIVANACLTKKPGNDQNHCNQVLLLATSIYNLRDTSVPNDSVRLEQLRLDCTVNDAKRSGQCLQEFHEMAGKPLGALLEELATKYKK